MTPSDRTAPDFTICSGTGRLGNREGRHVKCPVCGYWLLALQIDPYGVVRHTGATPAEVRNAWATIVWEYRQARKAGTLVKDENRWHVPALDMARGSVSDRRA